MFDARQPVLDQGQDGRQVQMFVAGGVFSEIGVGQLEEGGGGTEAFAAQMNKRPRELDQAFVKGAVGAVPVLQPQVLQNIVGLVKKPAVKLVKVAQIMRIGAAGGGVPDQAGNAFALVAHPMRLPERGPKPQINFFPFTPGGFPLRSVAWLNQF